MELIEGPTLDECWNRLGTIEKRAISDQLSRFTETLRQLEQDPSDQFIGSINRQRLRDYVFMSQLLAGPFPSIKEFNDWFTYPNHASFAPVQIVIVNWQQAGWYPDCWEYCKAFYTCWDSEWRKDYVDKFYSLARMCTLFFLIIAWRWGPINSMF
ncbi:hypothetical protein P875_00042418 [Aspergillus parasiticus SU-1]|uniref:Uncharacterized protein n=1 Tax=Aspergillus parasiticus (strain ATCC 56775 / NRRL 5862 / SRRC 143 / SU-1) TaxID=1403190 RepID=A0A0F0I3Z1_ASPPU|nr:hypothetical protein P875_00042418 [Aspergillus parasiticus SU-1]